MANLMTPLRDFPLTPLREWTDSLDRMDRFFSEFMNKSKRRSGEQEEFNFSPSCEVSEAGNNYIMKVDLPGVHKDQVKVEIDQDRLTISAERREEKQTESEKKFLSEVSYGSYLRSFALPGAVDESKVEAKFENGVLTVKVPKMESSKVKRISIH